MVGQLFLANPESKWSFFLEHKESLRSYNHNFSTSKDSFIRNRTQIGATRKMYASDIGQFNLNVTYRKESNDSAPGTQARPSNTMFWLMPSGTYNFNDKWAFNFWDAVYHYDNFHAPIVMSGNPNTDLFIRSTTLQPPKSIYTPIGHGIKTLIRHGNKTKFAVIFLSR